MSAKSEIVCQCSEIIVKSENGQVKLRSKILIFKANNEAYAVCKSCNAELKIPITLDQDSFSIPSTPLIIKH
jgi:hypothetical protein